MFGAAKAPPAGEIWFGRSFDTTTFEVHDKLGVSKITEEVAMVASFSKTAEQNVRFQLVEDGQVIYEENVALAEPAQVYGVILRPSTNIFPSQGTYTLRFIDAGGATLAEGRLIVTT